MEEQRQYLVKQMTPENRRRWRTFTAAQAELRGRGLNNRIVEEVLRGRFGTLSIPAYKRNNTKTLVPLPVGLTVEAVDEMNKDAAKKAYTSYIGPLKREDVLKARVGELRQALKQAIHSRA